MPKLPETKGCAECVEFGLYSSGDFPCQVVVLRGGFPSGFGIQALVVVWNTAEYGYVRSPGKLKDFSLPGPYRFVNHS